MSLRRRAALALAALAAVPVGFFVFMYVRISNPSTEHPPLPPGLVSLDSGEGQRLRASATARADLAPLERAFQIQEKGSWCGVATSAALISALRGERVSQTSVLSNASDVRSFLAVTFGGLTLDLVGGVLRANGVNARVTHAAEASTADFRAALRENLGNAGDYLAVNYARESLGQGNTGHISPVAAYDETSDRVLILDTARYKWPATWVPVEDLFRAMSTIDSDGGKSRGWVVVTR